MIINEIAVQILINSVDKYSLTIIIMVNTNHGNHLNMFKCTQHKYK